MPWTAKQHRLFEAAAHDPKVAKRVGIPRGKAAHMAHEGVMERPMNPVMHTHHPMEAEVKHESARKEDEAARGMEKRALRSPAAAKGNDYEHERPDEHPGERGRSMGERKAKLAAPKGPFRAGRKAHHVMFGPGEGHGSGFEHSERAPETVAGMRSPRNHEMNESPDNFGKREGHDGVHTGEYRSNDEKSARMEGEEFGTENIKHNLGSKRASGYGDPKAGTTGLPGFEDAEHGGDLQDENRGTHELPRHQYAAKREVPQETKERLAKALSHHRHR